MDGWCSLRRRLEGRASQGFTVPRSPVPPGSLAWPGVHKPRWCGTDCAGPRPGLLKPTRGADLGLRWTTGRGE